jgi:hypothetical protein
MQSVLRSWAFAAEHLRRAGLAANRDSILLTRILVGANLMGRLKSEQAQLFYQFQLDDAVPQDHLVRKIDTALDLSWLRSELAPHYSCMGRPSIDPELMIHRC